MSGEAARSHPSPFDEAADPTLAGDPFAAPPPAAAPDLRAAPHAPADPFAAPPAAPPPTAAADEPVAEGPPPEPDPAGEEPAADREPSGEPGPGRLPAGIIAACEALGTLWATYNLYPEPAQQPIFVRASEELRTATAYPFLLDVGPRALQWHGQDIEARRDGVDRLAKALFLHDVAALHMVAPPSIDDISALFAVVALENKAVLAAGGPRAALASRGTRSFELISRALLNETDEFDEGGRRNAELSALLERADEPEALAAELLDAVVDPGPVADEFIRRYLGAVDLIAANDYSARETVVRFFVEAVFCLPAEHRGEVLGRLLDARSDTRLEILLDQFSGHDLAEIATDLEHGQIRSLYEYARVASDSADLRPDDLLKLLQPSQLVHDARRAVAGRVEHVLSSTVEEVAAFEGEAFLRLRAQVPSGLDGVTIGTNLLRRLIEVEDRDVRLRRVLRIWTGRVASLVRAGDLEQARVWLEAVLDDPPYAPEHAGEVQQALLDVASPRLLGTLVSHLAEDGEAAAVEALLRAWGPTVIERFVEQLADEEQPAKRRVLMDFLVTLGRIDPTPLVAYLDDSRWYVVRNLCVILRRIGRREVGPRLEPLVSHPDYRVRVEALRALVPLTGDASTAPLIAALNDSHERVRHAALGLLRTAADPAADVGLAAALASNLGQVDKERIVGALAERARPDGIAALERCANRRIAVTPGQRLVRDAARAALRKVAS